MGADLTGLTVGERSHRKDKSVIKTDERKNSTPWSVPQVIENRCSYEHLYRNVHSNTMHGSQEVEATRLSIGQ